MNDTTSPPDGVHDASAPPPPRRGLGTLGDVRRSRDDRVVAGVCGGVARHFDVDPVVVRVLTVVLCFVGLAGLILYVAAWLFLPADGEPRSNVGEWFGLDERERQVREVGLVSAAVLAVVAVVGDGGWGSGPEWLFWVTFWIVLPVGIVLWILRRGRRGPSTSWEQGHGASSYAPPAPAAATSHDVPGPVRGPVVSDGERPDPEEAVREEAVREDTAVLAGPVGPTTPSSSAPPAPPAPPASTAPSVQQPPRRPREPFTWVPTLLALSVVAIAGAVLKLTADPEWTAYVAVALGVVGLALVLSTFTRGGGPLVLLGLALTAALTLGTVVPSPRAGDQEVAPTSAADLRTHYDHGFGRFTLDLTGLDETDLVGRDVEIDSGLGETIVIVPDGVPVTSEICAHAGDLVLLDQRTSGVQVCLDQPGTGPALNIDVQHTAGRVEVTTR